jgi:hypothetical protein
MPTPNRAPGLRAVSNLLLTSISFDKRVVRLVSDADTGPVREHAGGNVHTQQLLEQKLRCVRNLDLRDLGLVVAGPTFVVAFLDLSVDSR